MDSVIGRPDSVAALFGLLSASGVMKRFCCGTVEYHALRDVEL